jgi:uncharacterized phage protein (TIGR02218 family)
VSRAPNSAFYQKLQSDGLLIAELIDLELTNGGQYHWTTANGEVTYTLSGSPTKYVPFPGHGGNIQEDMNLGVSVLAFTLANSGPILQDQLLSTDFSLAGVKIGQVFTDTPDLGRMDVYLGKMGDFSYNRLELTGQARNIWKSLNVRWPYYTYQEKCGWRFGSAGCGFNTASITLNVSTLLVTSSTTEVLRLNTGSLSGFTNGRFNFGRCTITGGTNSGAIRTIRAHSGDCLELSHALSNPDFTGITLAIYPGCQKRLIDDCKSLYNNDANFLGWPWIPTEENAF